MIKYAPNFIGAMHFEKRSKSSQRDWQNNLLNKTIEHAKLYTSFYAHVDRDIKNIGFTEKSDLQANKIQFLANSFTQNGVWRSTSGSSGKIVNVFWDNRNLFMRFIFMYRAFSMIGLTPFKKLIYALPDREDTGSNFGLFRNRHISLRDSVEANLKIIKDFKPHLLSIYPSYAANLAEKAVKEDFGFVEVISLNSENVLDYHIRKISETFSAPIFQEYSTVELGVVAAMCKEEKMHIFNDNVYLECIRADGSICENGEEGELVATTLQSRGMPLLRYKTGDLGSIDTMHQCACGRHSPILSSLRGRQDDYLIGENSAEIPAWKLYEAIERPVEEGKIFKDIYLSQNALGKINFYFIPDTDFKPEIEKMIKNNLKNLCGTSTEIFCHSQTVIDRPESVKRKYIHREINESKT